MSPSVFIETDGIVCAGHQTWGAFPALSFLPKQIARAMRAQTRGRRPADESMLIDVAAISGANQLTTAIGALADSSRAPLWPG